ncbi:MAG: protein kinase domain-containing protein [Planctomycetota bacterium]
MNEQSLFDAAWKLPPGPARNALLHRECAGNPELRERIEERLRNADLPTGILRENLRDRHSSGQIPQTVSTIDEYDLFEEIGRGGMGVVRRGWHRRLRKPVAIKLLRSTVRDDDATRRTLIEMAALGRLRHPNLLQAYDARVIDGVSLIVTELIEGTSIDRLISNGQALPPATACDYARQAACGLAAAHEQNLVHRDIKPANLIVEHASETVKLLDFGLALLLRRDDFELSSPTGSQTILGTTHFMPPEQWADSHQATPASDIYSLGVTLFWMLAGKPPFLRTSVQAYMHAHCMAERPPVPGVDPELSRLVQSMMSIDPAGRPSAQEVIRELDRYCVGPVPSILPSLVEVVERHGVAGRIGPEIERVKKYLQRLPRRRILTLFREAGEYLGKKGPVQGPERGLTALIQIFLEAGDDREALELGKSVVAAVPDCFDALHLTAVAARQSAVASADQEELLREAIKLELAAQQTPSATLQANYGPSLSVLAQTYHNLAAWCRSRGDHLQAQILLEQAIACFQRRLALQETGLGLALYAQALLDAGDISTAAKQAARACEKDWFLREAQLLVLQLTERSGVHLKPEEENVRRWSLVVGEWPGTPNHRTHLQSYRTWLRQNHLLPALAAWEQELPPDVIPLVHALTAQATRKTTELTLQLNPAIRTATPQQLNCHVMLWHFLAPQPHVIAGIQAIRLFATGKDQRSAVENLKAELLMLHEPVTKSRHLETPLLVATKSWFAERIH